MRKIAFLTLMMILGMSSVSFGKEKILNLYRWEFSDRIVWKTFGVDLKQVQYEGETKNGFPHGLGYTYFYKKENVRYYGEWKEGLKHGEGEMKYSDAVHKGQWKEGRIWYGIEYDKYGKEITDKFVNGVRVGK